MSRGWTGAAPRERWRRTPMGFLSQLDDVQVQRDCFKKRYKNMYRMPYEGHIRRLRVFEVGEKGLDGWKGELSSSGGGPYQALKCDSFLFPFDPIEVVTRTPICSHTPFTRLRHLERSSGSCEPKEWVGVEPRRIDSEGELQSFQSFWYSKPFYLIRQVV